MFKRKLSALEHPQPDSFDLNDDKKFRNLVLWLENMKIRVYKIEDRDGLRHLDSPNWTNHFQKYLQDVECPFVNGTLCEQIDWLLGYAVDLEYSDGIEKYKNITAENILKSRSAPKIVSSSSLDNLDFGSDEFKEGIKSLANLLNVQNHPDHLVTLQAISKLICERLNETALKNPDSVIQSGNPYPFEDTSSGLKTKDSILQQASKVLQLLFIQDLRILQTRINECIVAAQKVTADPRTDTKLGQVGY